jgi:hypothetical protein
MYWMLELVSRGVVGMGCASFVLEQREKRMGAVR